jgi:ABC-type lipoprotein release transport system permease subunit
MIFGLAFRNVFRNRRRTSLTIVMVAVAIALMIVFQGLINGVTASITESATKYDTGDIELLPKNAINASLSMPSLLNNTNDIQAILADLDYVEAFSPRITMSSALVFKSTIQGIALVAVDPVAERNTTAIASSMVNGTYFDGGEDIVVLGQTLADSLGIKLNDKITLLLANNTQHNFTVSGMFSTGITDFDEKFVYVKLGKIQDILGLNRNQASEIVVTLKDPSTVDKSAADIASKLAQTGIECDVKTWKDLSQSLLAAIELNQQVLGIIYVIALVIAGMGIMNTMFMSVSERTREIGILQAVGMNPGGILRIFLSESLIIGLIGGVFGSIVGAAIAYSINSVGLKFPSQIQVFPITKIQASIDPSTVLFMLVFALALSLVAGVYPAWRASRREPVEALRYE